MRRTGPHDAHDLRHEGDRGQRAGKKTERVMGDRVELNHHVVERTTRARDGRAHLRPARCRRHGRALAPILPVSARRTRRRRPRRERAQVVERQVGRGRCLALRQAHRRATTRGRRETARLAHQVVGQVGGGGEASRAARACDRALTLDAGPPCRPSAQANRSSVSMVSKSGSLSSWLSLL